MPELLIVALIREAIRGERRAVGDLVDLLLPWVQRGVFRALLRHGRSRGVREMRQEVGDLVESVFLFLCNDEARALLQWTPDPGAPLAEHVTALAEREAASILRGRRRGSWPDEPADDGAPDALPASGAPRDAATGAQRARLVAVILSQVAGAPEDAEPPASLTRPIRARAESAPRAGEAHASGGGADTDSLDGTSFPPMPADARLSDAPRDGGAPPSARRAPEPRLPPAAHRSGYRRVRRAATKAAPAWPRARLVAPIAAWLGAASLVAFLALRPAPFAPGQAPVPAYSLALDAAPPGGAAADLQFDVWGSGSPDGALRPNPQFDVWGSGSPDGALRPNPHVAPGAPVALTLRPATPAAPPIAVEAYLARGDEVRPWSVEIPVDGDGVARLSGTRGALFAAVPAGAWEMVFVIGRPEALPDIHEIANALRAANSGAHEGYCLVRKRIVLDSR